jgi:hypothetical protein
MPDLNLATIGSDTESRDRAREAAFAIVEDERAFREVVAKAQRFKFFQRYRDSMELTAVG